MGMRRFTRLTNGFSKKALNLFYAESLYFMHYNFCQDSSDLENDTGNEGRGYGSALGD